MKWIAITISLLAASCYWMYKESFAAESDIYMNRLVYLRKNNALFTGTLKTVDNASQAHQSFCNGIPCGTYAEQQNGGSYISKGEYIALDKLQAIKRAFPTDTITVSLWQAGGDIASDPYYLSVTVLKDNAFFKAKSALLPSSDKKLIGALLHDTQSISYNYLDITFSNALYNATRYYHKEYEMKDSRLSEKMAVYEEWQIKNGVMQQAILK